MERKSFAQAVWLFKLRHSADYYEAPRSRLHHDSVLSCPVLVWPTPSSILSLGSARSNGPPYTRSECATSRELLPFRVASILSFSTFSHSWNVDISAQRECNCTACTRTSPFAATFRAKMTFWLTSLVVLPFEILLDGLWRIRLERQYFCFLLSFLTISQSPPDVEQTGVSNNKMLIASSPLEGVQHLFAPKCPEGGNETISIIVTT